MKRERAKVVGTERTVICWRWRAVRYHMFTYTRQADRWRYKVIYTIGPTGSHRFLVRPDATELNALAHGETDACGHVRAALNADMIVTEGDTGLSRGRGSHATKP